MANPTTNYGFVLPTQTDLVTDLPADFDVALQGVDTRLKALQPGTTLGDLAYSSATANTNTRLGIGSAGQVLTVTAGVPVWTTPAAGGKLLQVQSGSTSAAVANSTNTYADTGLTVTITPSAATSKIMITSAFAYRKSAANAGNRANFRIMRGATEIFNDTDQSYTNTGMVLANSYPVAHLDSPSTTSATTYKIQIANDNNTANVEFNYNSLTFYIYATEIGA